MPFFQRDDKLLFFVHVPKAGGSSIEDYLIRRFGNIFLYAGGPRERAGKGGALMVPVTHLCAWDLEELLPRRIDLVFAVVRNPLDRILSEYRWQKGASRASRLSFSSWLRVMIEAARKDPRAYDNHIRPISDLVPQTADAFHLEDGLTRMVARIDDATGTCAPDIKIGRLKDRAGTSDPIQLSRQDVELIADYYAEDYERFGYALPDANAYEDDILSGVRTLAAGAIARMAVAKQHRDWLR